jgi:predicted nucleic acid-binding protein
MYFADTNILLRLVDKSDSFHLTVRQAVRNLRGRHEKIYTASQNLAEFWNVCTRPTKARGGYGLDIAETTHRVKVIERLITTLDDSPKIHQEWKRLVVAYSVMGVQVYDARLVAAMNVYGIQNIITLNLSDFARYSGINPIHPKDVK